ncbi:MAG: elongator complex protein 3 [Syntrophomonadaceae bacterium]|jgi:histone acetyltransferase (RNA polymerase elongator complex component)|nr:radical SAM protein [Bacillota bacterium]NLP22963.1 radical SAM protein [Syntrophomonadaceae bacterium]
MKQTRNIAIFIPHLGCPFRCCFCQQQKISATQHPPSISQVQEIIETALVTIPSESDVEVAFFGGTFTSLPEQLQNDYLECVQPYLKNRNIRGIRLSTRPDAIDINRLEALQQRGVTTIELGVQSLDNEVLRLSGRGYQSAQVVAASEMIHTSGIRLGIQLMVGLPGDNRQRDLETTRRTIALSPAMVRIYPTLIIAGTELEQEFRAGNYEPLSLEEAVEITANMYGLFTRAHIPVIRMGLHPSEELQQSDTVVAGPFHPAFGELVLQKVALEQARCLLKNHLSSQISVQEPILFCPPREYSQLVGPGRINIAALQTEFGLKELKVKSDQTLSSGSMGIGDMHRGITSVLTRERYLASI